MKLAFLLLVTTPAFAALPSVGPDFVRPTADVPAAYRDVPINAGAWKVATPADQRAAGDWWTVFRDPTLDQLVGQALAANQDLKAAAARVEQARALAGIARSAHLPQVSANAGATREQTSRTTDNPLRETLATTYRTPLVASWEIDLFGRVRRLSETARHEAKAAEASFEAVRLALTAEVASTYFTLRSLQHELRIVQSATALRQRAFELVNVRLRNGTAAEVDVARAETELATAQADAAEIANRQSAAQNALAVLLGQPASGFATSINVATITVPSVPAGLPSELLERRPDIAAAERALAAANARIGVAKAAFFPAISLTGSAGSASGDIDRLFQTDSRIWSIGPSLYLPIFQGGRNRANLQRSRAAFDEAVATYRQRVLVAFRDVQDALTGTRWLAEQAEAQQRALAAAQRAAQLAQTRYGAGYVSYLEVIDAERTALAVERRSAQLEAQRLNASVALIKALGGGWHASRAGLLAVH